MFLKTMVFWLNYFLTTNSEMCNFNSWKSSVTFKNMKKYKIETIILINVA